MKILHVGLAYFPAVAYGGPLRSIKNLAEGMSALGHTVHICVTDSDGSGNCDVECNQFRKVGGIDVIYFHSPKLKYYGYSPGMKVWLKQHIEDYDMVHIHGIYSFPQIYAGRMCRKKGVPYIISPRGSADYRLARKYRFFMKWIYCRLYQRFFFSKAHRIHYTTIAEKVNSIIKHRDDSVCIVPNAVSFKGMRRTRVSPPIPYILFVGRLNWKKNIDILIQSFAAAAEKPEGCLLVIAGPDSDGLQKRLQALAVSLGVDERVKFMGVVTGDDLLKLYTEAALFVLPSVAENFGHSLAEAMVCQIPCIGSTGVDAVTIPEIGQITHICEPNRDSLQKAIDSVFSDYARCKKRAEEGAEEVRRILSIECVVEAMLSDYQVL